MVLKNMKLQTHRGRNMKKICFLSVLICLIFATCFSACGKTSKGPSTTKYNLSLNKTIISLEVGQTFQLHAKYGEETINFESDDANVASVSETGLVTAINAGVAYINVQGGGQSLLCKVDVTDPIYTIVLDAKEQVVVKEGGSTFMLQAVAYKDGSKIDSKIEYTIDKDGLQHVETKNIISIFKAEREGVYNITATIKEGAEATISVKVMKSGATILDKPTLSLNNNSVSWDVINGATAYLVRIDGGAWREITGTSVELGTEAVKKVYVQAICSGTNFYNSDVAEISL